jgi:hypothetical protein
VFAQMVDPQFRPRVYGALAGDLAIPVVGWFVMKRLNKPKAPAPPQA